MADFYEDLISGNAVVQYAAGLIEEVTSYTITGSTTNPTPGTGATFYRRTYRYGRMAKVRFEFKQAVSGSAGTGIYRLPMMPGLVIDTSKIAVSNGGTLNTDLAYCGDGVILIGNTDFSAFAYCVSASTISIAIDNQGATGATYIPWGTTGAGGLGAATIQMVVEIEVPIVGWDDYVAYGAGLATGSTPGLTYDTGTVELVATGTSLTNVRSSVRARGDKNGKWRLEGNIYVTRSGTAVTSQNISLPGVVFKNTPSFFQVITAGSNGAAGAVTGYVNPNTGNFTVEHASFNTTIYYITFNVELESKPSWA